MLCTRNPEAPEPQKMQRNCPCPGWTDALFKTSDGRSHFKPFENDFESLQVKWLIRRSEDWSWHVDFSNKTSKQRRALTWCCALMEALEPSWAHWKTAAAIQVKHSNSSNSSPCKSRHDFEFLLKVEESDVNWRRPLSSFTTLLQPVSVQCSDHCSVGHNGQSYHILQHRVDLFETGFGGPVRVRWW